MAKHTYTLTNGDDRLIVDNYTSLPKRVITADGETVELDQLIFDPRHFPDRIEQMVLWQVFREVARFDDGRQKASGEFYLNSIHKNTGYDRKTIWSRLRSLQARNILRYRAGKGRNDKCEVIINLRLDQWEPAQDKPKWSRSRPALPPSCDDAGITVDDRLLST